VKLLGLLLGRRLRAREIKEAIADSRTHGRGIMDAILPARTKTALLRVALLAVATWCVCKWLCLPMYIKGESMEPTDHSGRINFCWTPAFWRSAPKRGDIVIARYGGFHTMILKRVVALQGETVEFRRGRLFIDGNEFQEPYVKGLCDWNLPPRQVAQGCVYIIGDNRSVPMESHVFGEIDLKRIAGAPLW
jgi:signal peptidase I